MPGYIRGFLEKEYVDGWEFVSRLDPFVGPQGDFKYLVLAIEKFRYFDPFPHEEGFPSDLSEVTKMNLMSNPVKPYRQEKGIEEDFEQYIKHDIQMKRTVKISDLQKVDWDKGLKEENLEKLREDIDDWDSMDREQLQVFRLVDSEGNAYSDWGDRAYWYWEDSLEDRQIRSLVKGNTVENKGRELKLEKRTRREILPDIWFKFLDLTETSFDRESRLILYWQY